MTLARQKRHKAQSKRALVAMAEKEGRLRKGTSRCGPWIVSENGGTERCVKCGSVEFVGGLFAEDDEPPGPMGF